MYQDLVERFNQTKIIDTHEHLISEEERLAKNVSFTDLYWQYCLYDFQAAGMPKPDMLKMYNPATDLEEKWRLFKPWFELTKNGSYQRAGTISMEKIYGISELNTLEDAETVTEKMRAANKPGLYNHILKDICHLDKVMLFTNYRVDDPLYGSVWTVDAFTSFHSVEMLTHLEEPLGGMHYRFQDYLAALAAFVQKCKARGDSGFKLTAAYYRDLDFDLPTYSQAEAVFNRIILETSGRRGFTLGNNENRLLQNYLVNEFARLLAEADMCMVFHTGIQTGLGNEINNSQPDKLWSLFTRYPNTRFVLLHTGLPWTRETILLAKYFPNVYVDFAWTHLISPTIAKNSIREYIDMAPMNKLLGFGGDYFTVETVYGHLILARDVIASALHGAVMDGVMDAKSAYKWQDAMLYDNPKAVYKL